MAESLSLVDGRTLRERVADRLERQDGSGRLVISEMLAGAPDKGIRLLLDTHNDGQPLVVHDAVLAGASDASDVAEITGTASYRNVDAAPVSAVIRETVAGLDVVIRIALPPTWRFSQSFPKLPASVDFRSPLGAAPSPVLDLLTLSDAAFVLSTGDHVDEPLGARLPAGLSFVARLRLAGLFGAIEHTLGGGGETLVIAGPVIPAPPVPTTTMPPVVPASAAPSPVPLPGINLAARLDLDADLGPITVRDSELRLYCPPTADWLAQHPLRPPAVHFGGTLAVGAFALRVWALLSPGGEGFILTAEPEGGLAGFDLAAAAGLLGGDDLAAQLTPQLGDLGDLTLRTLTLAVSTAPPELTYASLTVGLDGVRWKPIGDAVEVTDLAATFAVAGPATASRSLSVLLVGTVTVEDVDVTVLVEAPGFTVTADVRDLPALPLSRLLRAYLPDVPPVADLTVRRMQIAAEPGRFLAISAELAAQPEAWTLDLGPRTLTVSDVALALGYAAGTGFTGAFSGRIALAGVDLRLGYQVPGPFALRADLPEIGLRALLGSLSDDEIPWPRDFDVVFEKSRVIIEKRDTRLALMLGTQVEDFGSVAVEVRRAGAKWGFAAGFALPTGWRLARLSPDLAPLDDVVLLRRMVMVIASFDDPGFTFPDLAAFGDPRITSPRISLPASAPGVRAGVNVFAELTFGGDRGLDLIRDSLHLRGAGLDVLVQIGANPADALLSAGLSGSFNENLAFTGALRVQLAGGVPSIGLLGQLTMEANGQPLRFTAQLEVGPNGAALAGTMKGAWTDALGVPGLTLADVALALGISWELVPTVGLAATVSPGRFTGSAAVLFDGTMPSRSLLAGSLPGLTMTDVVQTLVGSEAATAPELAPVLDGVRLQGVELFDLPGSLAGDLDGGVLTPPVVDAFLTAGRISLPTSAEAVLITVAEPGRRWHLTDRVALKHYTIGERGDLLTVSMQVQLYVAPQPTRIGQLVFPQGLRLSATVSAFGLGGSAEVDVDPSRGIAVDGWIDPIDAGQIFSLTGHAGEGGPRLSLATYDAPGAQIRGPHLVVSGAVTMLGFTRDIDVRASRDGFSFAVSATIFNVFEAAITATAPLRDFAAADLIVVATMRNDLLTILRTRGAEAIRAAADDAQRSIRDAERQLAGYQTQVNQIQAEIDRRLPQIRAERRAADDDVRKAQSDVDSIKAQIRAEQREIKRLNDRIESLKRTATILNGWNIPDIVARGAELAQHEITMASYQAGLATATGFLDAARAAVKGTPIELDPRVSGLYTQLGLATGGLAGAQAVLQQTNAAMGVMAAVGQWIAAHGPGNLLDVTGARFEGRLGAVSGASVRLQVWYVLMESPGDTTVEFNFHDVERGVSALVDRLKEQAATLVAVG